MKLLFKNREWIVEIWIMGCNPSVYRFTSRREAMRRFNEQRQRRTFLQGKVFKQIRGEFTSLFT